MTKDEFVVEGSMTVDFSADDELEPIWWRICRGVSFKGFKLRERRVWGFLWVRTEILYRDADGWHVGLAHPRQIVKRDNPRYVAGESR